MAKLSRNELDKLALKMVATDRLLAQAMLAACRQQARRTKPGARVERLVLIAASLSDALEATKVAASPTASRRSR